MKITYGEICRIYSLWVEYCGHWSKMTEAEFNAGSSQDRLLLLQFRGGCK